MWRVVFGKNCLYDLIKQYYVEAWVIVVEHQTADVFWGKKKGLNMVISLEVI